MDDKENDNIAGQCESENEGQPFVSVRVSHIHIFAIDSDFADVPMP